MANQNQLILLQKDVKAWNSWRQQNPVEIIDLREADLSGTDLIGADLSKANLMEADLSKANLIGADLSNAYLREAYLSKACLSKANLMEADLSKANLMEADLIEANLSKADLSNANLIGANLSKANLREACLSDANLSGANLRNANLSGAYFSIVDNLGRANLSGADLRNADLRNADLSDANLSGADLSDADLRNADLINANLRNADLRNADLSNATIGWTIFGEQDLHTVIGLETIQHAGPSNLSINTLYLSQGNLPEAFVRGTGAPDTFLEYMYALTQKPIQYYTCFISYSSKDRDFAERLYADLQNKGVRCWYDQENLKIGDRFPDHIERAIRIYDKFMVILSENSVHSSWVEDEVRAAQEKEEHFKQEQQLQKTVLFPIKIDASIDNAQVQWAARLRRQRHIGDFTKWKDYDSYQQAFQRLLRDLKNDAAKGST